MNEALNLFLDENDDDIRAVLGLYNQDNRKLPNKSRQSHSETESEESESEKEEKKPKKIKTPQIRKKQNKNETHSIEDAELWSVHNNQSERDQFERNDENTDEIEGDTEGDDEEIKYNEENERKSHGEIN